MKKSIIFGALAAAGMVASTSANATLVGGETLVFDDGVGGCLLGGTYPDACTHGLTKVVSGSFFGMDTSGNGLFEQPELTPLTRSGVGVTLGSAQVVGAIDTQWSFGGNPGDHHTVNGTGNVPTVNGDGSVDMTGWTVFWGDPQADIDMGAGAAATVACTSGTMTCADGESFTLDYTAIVPAGGFKGFGYSLHLVGTVSAAVIPVPAAAWLFGSGLLGLVGVARRRKAA